MNAGCLGKFRFESLAVAKEVNTRQKKRKDQSSNVYKCPECGGWHIGSHRKLPKRRYVEED